MCLKLSSVEEIDLISDIVLVVELERESRLFPLCSSLLSGYLFPLLPSCLLKSGYCQLKSCGVFYFQYSNLKKKAFKFYYFERKIMLHYCVPNFSSCFYF
jgi:hypothetical protein